MQNCIQNHLGAHYETSLRLSTLTKDSWPRRLNPSLNNIYKVSK